MNNFDLHPYLAGCFIAMSNCSCCYCCCCRRLGSTSGCLRFSTRNSHSTIVICPVSRSTWRRCDPLARSPNCYRCGWSGRWWPRAPSLRLCSRRQTPSPSWPGCRRQGLVRRPSRECLPVRAAGDSPTSKPAPTSAPTLWRAASPITRNSIAIGTPSSVRHSLDSDP